MIYYCSKECQTKECSYHKFVCDALPFPKKTNPENVYAFYLPENGDKVILVEVPFKKGYNE